MNQAGMKQAIEVRDRNRRIVRPDRPAPQAPTPRYRWWCHDCRAVGMIHCSDPINCGGMKREVVRPDRQAEA